MKKIPIYLFLIIAVSSLFAKKVLAVCPICTVAVGAGVGLSRWLGIDDSIAGLWIGGFIVSLIYWTIDWLKKKNLKFKWSIIFVIIFWYLITILPLYFTGLLGIEQNSLFCFCGFYFFKLTF